MLKPLLLLATVTAGPPSGGQPSSSEARSVDFLGVRFCAGPSALEDCDFQVFPSSQEERPSPNEEAHAVPVALSLMGTKLCLGDVPTSASCDIHLGGRA